MRFSASSHYLSYRTSVCSRPGGSKCLTLDCKSILNLLHALDESSSQVESSSAMGQKRPRPLSHMVSRKRRVLGTEQSNASSNESIPVLHHEFDLHYSKECLEVCSSAQLISDNEAEEDGLISSEETLVDFLRTFYASPTAPITLDCGDVLINSFGEYGGTVDAKPPHLEEQWADLCNIFVLPPLNAECFEKGGHLFSWVDALTRFPISQPAVELTAGLRMVILPLTSWDETLHTLPFRFVVDVVLSFRPPAIFWPPPYPCKGQTRIEVENARRGLLHLAFPFPLPETLSISFQGRIDVPFLYAVVQPAGTPPHESVDKLLQPQALLPRLLPFQRRAVGWMLSREGKAFGPTGELAPMVIDPAELPVLWRRVTIQRDDEELTWYYHRLTETLTPERPSPRAVLGGILAEEPGLGKTLECIALILLNPGIGQSGSQARLDSEAGSTIREIRTTLIVTPSSLSQQWIDELTRHTPSLKVLVYPGWKSLSVKPKKSEKTKAADVTDPGNTNTSLFDSWPAYINDFDVCVTTYDTLRQDLAVARVAPSRPVRQTAEYSRHKRPISPLVMCEWYRVIMDEVQMVGGGKASEMVSLIPRLSSFAVSGTPARTRVSDLSYVLKFLRVDPSIYAPRNWNKLIQPSYAAEFAAVFQRYTVRTIKSTVQAELTIPVQTRYVFPIHLGRVERHVYDENLEKALLNLGLDVRGVVASRNGDVDATLLRTWLRKLRQICTHPQVGQLQKLGEKSSKSGVLKTMRQVLEGMKDQNWRNVMDDRCSKINEMITATQLMQHDVGIDQRPQRCLEMLLQAEREADEVITDVLSAITDHDAKGVELKAEAALLRAERGTGRHGLHDPIIDDENDDESDDGGLPKTLAGDEHLHKSRALQQRLRDCYLTLHKVKFLQGDIYHWIGESKAVSEEVAYTAADGIRKRLLKFTEESAVRAMAQLRTDVGRRRLVKKDILVRMPYCPRGGILSAYLLEEADKLIDQVLNAQSHLLWQWRMHIYSLLTRSLTASNDEGEADGQEYSRTLDTQGEAETYLQAYAMLIADRREILTAERTALAVHDARERKYRKTAAAAKAITMELDEPDIGLVAEDIELQPEHEVLKENLMDARKTLLVNFAGRAVKSIVVDLTAVAAKVAKEDDPEKVLAREGASSLRQLMSAQAIINEQIEADLALFRKAFNERILYFRQLQEISDSVGEAPWDDVVDVGLALQRNRDAQTRLERRIVTGRARQRYLTHLSEEQDLREGEADKCCILCECEFLRGYITQCAHALCETCMETWLSRHGNACPVCRFPIKADALQRFSIQKEDKDEAAQPPEKPQGDPIPKSPRKIEYNTIGPSVLAEIDTMEVGGSYGTKIDTLVRHLLYLQLTDAGAKSIVFSAWEDSLHIIEHALTRNGIPSIRIDSGNRRKQNSATRFRNDPDILVLLLHGERQNAGLNVTCASRVFLLESVVHHSFEVQAIARIDRLGQLRPTEVYCYYAEDTVERNILDLAARQGLSLYTTDRACGAVDTTVLALAGDKSIIDAPGKKQQKGDFIFRVDDMMSILFPHLCEDVEFLLPPEDVEMRDCSIVPASASASSYVASPSRNSRRVHENAVAGPSRLG